VSAVSRPLDRSSSVPLWAQLEAELRRRVDAGDFDERFPTDKELTRQYEVSRHTVREAIRHLNGRGLLERVRGRGTVLNRAEFEQSLGALYSLFESIEASGVEQRSQVLALEPTTDAVAAERLGLAPDAELVLLERVRWAGDAPLAVDRAWLPAELGRPLLDVDFTHTALYDELERTLGIRPNEGWERITPIVPTPNDRRLLGLSTGDAAFFLQRSGQRDGRLLEWRTSVIRGDRYRFVARWSAGAASDLRLAPAD
jgi:GntR family transcriptional regulator